jgi:hypothetical protein
MWPMDGPAKKALNARIQERLPDRRSEASSSTMETTLSSRAPSCIAGPSSKPGLQLRPS